MSDRALFVTSSLVALASWMIASGTTHIVARWVWGFASATLVAATFWQIWQTGLDGIGAGSFLVVVLGAVVGCFAGKFFWHLFSPNFGRHDPLVAVLTLSTLLVVYCLPTYQKLFLELARGVGLSSVKTPIIELNFLGDGAARGRSASLSVSGGDVGGPPQAIARVSDPLPGLSWLANDVSGDDRGLLASDKEYLRFFLNLENESSEGARTINEIFDRTGRYLAPARLMSDCLTKYVRAIPDSHLLLIDIKPIISALFLVHEKAKGGVKRDKAAAQFAGTTRVDGMDASIRKVLKSVRETLDDDNDEPIISFKAGEIRQVIDMIVKGLIPTLDDDVKKVISERRAEIESKSNEIARSYQEYWRKSGINRSDEPDAPVEFQFSSLVSLVELLATNIPHWVVEPPVARDGEQPHMADLIGKNLKKQDVRVIARQIFDASPANGYRVNDTRFKECHDRGASSYSERNSDSPTEIYLHQPYVTLVLSDLLLAHGAPDQAIQVLSEWLTFSEADYSDRQRTPVRTKQGEQAADRKILEWFRLRVASRLAVLLAEAGGPSNRAYRDLFNFYQERFTGYVSSSSHSFDVGQIATRCKMWAEAERRRTEEDRLFVQDKLSRAGFSFPIIVTDDIDTKSGKYREFRKTILQAGLVVTEAPTVDIITKLKNGALKGDVVLLNSKKISDPLGSFIRENKIKTIDIHDFGTKDNKETMERRVYFLLLDNEMEKIKVETHFLAEVNSFETLRLLLRKVELVASVGPDCFPLAPDPFSDASYRAARAADNRVNAGLAAIIISERMSAVAKSLSDRNDVDEARRKGEILLRDGWRDLRPVWMQDIERIADEPWSRRIFDQSQWERTAYLATKALSQLQRSSD